MLYFLIFLVLLAGDQTMKWWITDHLGMAVYDTKPFLNGFVELKYVQNTGGGWSILSEHTWLLTALTAVILIIVALLLILRIIRHPMGLISCTLILSGGMGNFIDRVRLGYVVDMFHFEFWQSYPVFNIADMAIVVGMILAAIYYLFFYEKYDAKKKEQSDGADEAAGDK